ncbi:MAG: polysaccharide deacetylase family protein, partial [Candidatus Eremiobacteraeota bacterium]|nr:polysaccharide deacetylase family protein [Candidatus Eremiobacteraeota bacterium]
MASLLAVILALPIVLMYHRVDVAAPSDRISQALTISPAQFSAELQYLRDRHLRTMSVAELEADIRGGQSPTNAVLLTFDDGYDDQYQYAFSLLRRFGDVATFFVNVGSVGSPRHLTWQQIAAMSQAGMSFGCHGVSHADLATLGVAAQTYQIDRCVDVLSARLHDSIIAYAYPSGAFDEETIRLEQHAGLLLGFTTDPRFQRDADSLYELTRRRVKNGMTAADFASLLLAPVTYIDVPGPGTNPKRTGMPRAAGIPQTLPPRRRGNSGPI